MTNHTEPTGTRHSKISGKAGKDGRGGGDEKTSNNSRRTMGKTHASYHHPKIVTLNY